MKSTAAKYSRLETEWSWFAFFFTKTPLLFVKSMIVQGCASTKGCYVWISALRTDKDEILSRNFCRIVIKNTKITFFLSPIHASNIVMYAKSQFALPDTLNIFVYFRKSWFWVEGIYRSFGEYSFSSPQHFWNFSCKKTDFLVSWYQCNQQYANVRRSNRCLRKQNHCFMGGQVKNESFCPTHLIGKDNIGDQKSLH